MLKLGEPTVDRHPDKEELQMMPLGRVKGWIEKIF